MVLFPPFLQDFSFAGWKGVIDHSLCESLKTLNAGKQSKVTTPLSHLGPVDSPYISSPVWKDLPSKFQLLLGKYNTILAGPLQRGLFLQPTPCLPLSRWIKLHAESLTEGFSERFPERLISSQFRNIASTATLWHWSICTFSPRRQQEAQSQARM